MGQMLDTVRTFFTQQKWAFDEAKERPILRMGFAGENGRWVCYAHVQEEDHRLIFYSVYEGSVPPSRRAAVAELFSRLNFIITVGDFELDFDDGNARCRTSIDVEGEKLSPPLVKNTVMANVAAMDMFLPALKGVIEGQEPAAALAAAQKR
jgi:hypothetical protein